MKILHINNIAAFMGGVERILHDIAFSLSASDEQGLLFLRGGSTHAFDHPFAWKGMSLTEALEDFQPDLAIVHKVDDADFVARVCRAVPTLVFVHDHDLTCPRRHKYTPGSDRACERAAGIGCVSNLCFVEKAPQEKLVPVVLFDGIRRQRRQFRAALNARGFIVASEAMRRELVNNGVASARVNIIAPIPRSADEPAQVALAGRREILFVGQVIRGKGVDLLIRAFGEPPNDTRLTVVGDGNHLRECRALAGHLGLLDRITFTGWVDHEALNEHYDRARLLAVPSRWPEPFGMVGIEAMSRGKPVVAFDSGGISDWLADGLTGLLAESGNTADLAQKMHSLLDDEASCHAMGREAMRVVARNFSHRRFIAQLKQLARNTIHEHADLRLRS